MRVSEHYHLGVGQPQLDFVDVQLDTDSPLFIDPRALHLVNTDWGRECVALVRDYFETVLRAIRDGDGARVRALLGELHEPNETRLGLSQGQPRGRALGPELADRLASALENSRAVQTGLLTDLEDTILLIEGIAADLVSDIATNVIREPLVEYTRQACDEHGIATEQVYAGPIWDPTAHAWTVSFVDLPKPGRPLLLVPKALVRQRMDYDADEYFDDYVLEQLRADEFDQPGSALVEVLKNGKTRVTKKALKEKYGSGKVVNARVTQAHPQLLDNYRRAKGRVRPPLAHDELSELAGTPEPDWDALLNAVVTTPAGRTHADDYHRRVQDLLSPLFWPALAMPQRETRIHGGRKRIDITYANVAPSPASFFGWLAQHYDAANVIVECKNYDHEVANAELDQLAGRFSPNRGRFGFLLCRSFRDKALFIQRCRDTADDGHGYIIALDDDDLRVLVEARKAGDRHAAFTMLRERFNELTM